MAVTSTTFLGVPVFQFSGAVTDAEVQAAFASTLAEGRYVLNRAIYLDATANLTGLTGGFFVDFGTQVSPAFIFHNNRDKTKSTFNNFIFLQRTGLIVSARTSYIQTTNGTSLANAGASLSTDGLSINGGAVVYAVPGNSGLQDKRYLNEMAFAEFEGATIMSQEFTEEELQVCVGKSMVLKGNRYEKVYGFPQIGTPTGSVNVVNYRSFQNTQSTLNGGLIPIRLFPSGGRYAAECFVDCYVTRNNADITSRLIDTYGSNATNIANIMILNNYTRGSWFGTTKTNIAITTWYAGNSVFGGVLKKLQFIGGGGGGVVRVYDSRSSTQPQKSSFKEIGFIDFLDPNTSPAVDSEGKISLVHIGAIATGTGAPITRYTGQKYTYQEFGFRVIIGYPDMTSGDNDLSAFAPITKTAQTGLKRTLANINAGNLLNATFQELLEELHVLAINLIGASSYNAAYDGNLFNFESGVITTLFASVNIDPNAAQKIAYNAQENTLTIKSSVLSSNNVVTQWNNIGGTINLLNGAKINGVYGINITSTENVLANHASAEIIVQNLENFRIGSKVSANGLIADTYVIAIDGTKVTLSNPYTGASGNLALNVLTLRTSTVLTINGHAAHSAIYVEDNNAVEQYYNADTSGSVALYLPPNASGNWYYAVEKYGNQRQSDYFTFSGGYKTITVKDIPDNKLLLTKAQSATIMLPKNPDEAYDVLAILREQRPYISFGQIASKDGSTFYAGDYSIVFDINAEKPIEVDYDDKLITIKSAIHEDGPVCKLVKVDSPATVTAQSTEVITINIEDANGDSTTEIKGVDGKLVDVWKCINGTVNADYATGTKIASNIGAGKFRFLSSDGYKLIFFDKNLLIARDCSMSKGTYTLGWYTYDDERGGLNQNQSAKFNSMFNTLNVVDSNVVNIQNKVDDLNNYNDTNLIAKIDAIKTVVDSVKTTVEDKTGYSLTTAQVEAIAVAVETHLLNEGDSQQLINAIVTSIGNSNVDETILVAAIRADLERTGGKLETTEAKVLTLNNADFTATNAKIDAVKTVADSTKTKVDDFNQLIVDLGAPLQAADYVAPDNDNIVVIKDKVTPLVNADFTATNAKIDAVANAITAIEPTDLQPVLNAIEELPERVVDEF